MARTCFVIAPIGQEGSVERKWSDALLERVIAPAVSKYGYEARRGDHEASLGIVTEAIVHQLVKAPLAVADLTFDNPNVYYELGVRHVFNRPVIQVAREGHRLPFDIKDMRTVRVDVDDATATQAREKIERLVDALEPKATEDGTLDTPGYTTPISQALGVPGHEYAVFLAYEARRSMLTSGERDLLSYVERHAAEETWIEQRTLERAFKRYSAVYWRLENLCSLGFLTKKKSGQWKQWPLYSYQLSPVYGGIAKYRAAESSGE